MYKLFIFAAFAIASVATIAGLFAMIPTTSVGATSTTDSRVLDIIDKAAESIDESKPATSEMQLYVPPADEEDGGGKTVSTPAELPSAQSDLGNPLGCYGITENPHKSTGYNNVNVHASSRCPNRQRVDTIGVHTQLYQAQCIWSAFCTWQPHGTPGFHQRTNAYSVDTSSHGPCENGQYLGSSAHWIIEDDGDMYYAVTQEENSVTNC